MLGQEDDVAVVAGLVCPQLSRGEDDHERIIETIGGARGARGRYRTITAYPTDSTVPWGHALKVIGTFLALWLIPLGVLYAWRGASDTLVQEMRFFTQAAFVTFGGAYAVLSYIADVAVNGYGWLTSREMVRGLGLAELTPGPLIMVTEYVGFVAAWKTAPSDVPEPCMPRSER